MLANLYAQYRRAARADQHRLARPVISIGNISMGGRGETPLAALVASILIDAGERPSILSRGYGREIADEGVTVVSDGHAVIRDGRAEPARPGDLAHSGDEPLMLARAVPGAAVLVCEDRALAGTFAEHVLGCTVHVLDDGFQHHRLYRDIDIVLVAPEDFAGRPLPFGKLREPVEVLQFAGGIILDPSASVPTAQSNSANVPECHIAAISTGTFSGSLVRELGTVAPWHSGTPVFAVAGIARPERFFDALAAAGYTVVGSLGFADHHRYSSGDVSSVREAALNAGASAILTTSKDIVRLEKFMGWPVPLIEIPLQVSVEPAESFRTWLLGRLAEARRAEASADAKAARA